jgi:hypothetical protein
LNKDTPTYSSDEPIIIELTVFAYEEIENFYIRMEVLGMDDIPVGAAISGSFGGLKRDEKKIFTIKFNPIKLVNGKYKVTLLLFDMNEFGNNRDLDGVSPCFVFEIQDKNVIEWNPKRWGNIRFEDLAQI